MKLKIPGWILMIVVVIETEGIGYSNPALSNVTQREAMACQAASVEAQNKMLSKMQQRASEGPEKNSSAAHGVVRGASVVKTEISKDHCRVVLRLDPV